MRNENRVGGDERPHQCFVTRSCAGVVKRRVIFDRHTQLEHAGRHDLRTDLQHREDGLLFAHDPTYHVVGRRKDGLTLPTGREPESAAPRLGGQMPRRNCCAVNCAFARFLPSLQQPVADAERFDEMAGGLGAAPSVRLNRVHLPHEPRQKVQEPNAYLQGRVLVAANQALGMYSPAIAAGVGFAVSPRQQTAEGPALAILHGGTIGIKDVSLVKHGVGNPVHE